MLPKPAQAITCQTVNHPSTQLPKPPTPIDELNAGKKTLKDLGCSTIDEAVIFLIDEAVIFLKEQGKGLTRLDLACFKNAVSDEHVEVLLKLFPNLNQVFIQSNIISDESLERLSKLIQLQSLSLDACYKITDAGLTSLSALKSLQSLNLEGCNEITEAAKQALKDALPQLYV